MSRHRCLPLLLELAVSLPVAGCAPSSPAPAHGAPPSGASGPDAEAWRQRERQRVDNLVAGDFDCLAEMLSSTLDTHANAALDSKETFMRDRRSGQVVVPEHETPRRRGPIVTPDVAILNGLSDAAVTVGGQDLSRQVMGGAGGGYSVAHRRHKSPKERQR